MKSVVLEQDRRAFPSSPIRIWSLYWIIAVIGVLFQLAYFYADDTLDRDSIFYIRGVEVWYRTGDFSQLKDSLISSRNTTAMKYYTAPFYLFVLKTLKCIFPKCGIELLGRWWGVLAGGTAICLSMLCARRLFRDDAAALLAGFLLAIHPRFAGIACRLLRDMTYLLLVISVLYLCLVAWQQRSALSAAAAGFLCFAGIFCRIEFLALMAMLAPLAIWDMVVSRRRGAVIWGTFAVFVMVGFVMWTWIMGIPWDFFSVYVRRFLA